MPGPGNPSKLKPAQKGEVRNPKGRPKGSRDRASVLRELLAIPINVKRPDGSTIPGATLEDAVGMALVQKALKGDVPAIREIYDTLHGKVTEKVENTTAVAVQTIKVRIIGDAPPIASDEDGA